MGPSLKEMNRKQHFAAIAIAGFLILGQLGSGNVTENLSGTSGVEAIGFLGGFLIAAFGVGYGLIYVFGEEPDGKSGD